MNIFRSITNFLKRKSTAAYDGAGHGKRLGNWYPSNSSINSLLASSLSTLRTRSHDIVRKNPYALNAIEAIVSNCIGTGIKPQSKAKDAEFRKQIQELWLKWTDESDVAEVCDFMACKPLCLEASLKVANVSYG